MTKWLSMRTFRFFNLITGIWLFLFIHAVESQSIDGFSEASARNQIEWESHFKNTVDFDLFKKHLEQLTLEPHVAGTPANEKVRDYMAEIMTLAGWKTDIYPYDVYLSKGPGESTLEIVTPVRSPLNQQEYILKENPYSSHPDLWKGWNAYSGSGDVTGEVVYANYGTKRDFEQLKEMGIDLHGKIVIARYGGNFRGYKAKFAEEYGASGLIIYTDPGDAGYARGLPFPEGPFFSESTIQRGSLLTVDWTGDPLTPFQPALPLDGDKQIERLDPESVGFHSIPVVPIGYASAKEIMTLMKGKPVPSGWQGHLPFTYRLEGGPDLTVRLKVHLEKDFVRIHNVIGMLEGSEFPDEWIILGCHYDAWGYGATDPNSGTAMLLSLSETLGKMAREGKRPKRSILIGHWDAEEHGVIGSSEWVEEMKDELSAKAITYINLDGAVSGKYFGASAAPSMKQIVLDAGKEVMHPYTGKSIFETWAGDKPEPVLGNLGGGSDHIAFYMHIGIPSVNAGAGGPTLYHSNYDDLYYYQNFVDPEFKMGGTVEQIIGIISLRLANADLIPYDVERYALDLKMHFENHEKKIMTYDQGFQGFTQSKNAIESLQNSAIRLKTKLKEKLEQKTPKGELQEINRQLMKFEKSFIDAEGMPFGPWYRSLYASTDPFSGYASWILPGIMYEIEQKSSLKLDDWDEKYSKAIQLLINKMDALAQK